MSTNDADPRLIESIPPVLWKTIPAGQPPPGIQADFKDPPNMVAVILGVSIAFMTLAVFCFSIRIYTKLVMTNNWRWDDCCLDGTTGRHLWDLHLDQILGKSSLQRSYITTAIVTPALGFIKSSLFIQYYLLFRPLRWIRVSVWIGAAVAVTFYITVTVVGFVLLSAWPGESGLEAFLSWHYTKFAQFFIPTGVIGMLVDWYLLILPIPAVWALHMSTAKKLGVLIVFMTGGLAAIASTTSLYYRVQLQHNFSNAHENFSDPAWKAAYVLLWVQIEMFAGVAASSMTTVHQFFCRKKFSLAPWKSLKSIFTHLRSSSSRLKLSGNNSSSADWHGSNRCPSEDHQRLKTQDLESAGYEYNETKSPRVDSGHIVLTQDYSVTREQLHGTLFKPVVESHQFR